MSISAAEQYLLELINRARIDPLAEAARYGIGLNDGISASKTIQGEAMQVLALDDSLSLAAVLHSVWLLENNEFSHTGAGGSNAGERMADAGYDFYGAYRWGENLQWSGTTGTMKLEDIIEDQYDSLFLSPGHRVNTLNDGFREIGIGQVRGDYTYNGRTYDSAMLTEKFASTGSNVYLTGVAYNDISGDEFYSIGEGYSDFWAVVNGVRADGNEAGGYAVELAPDDNALVVIGRGSIEMARFEANLSQGNEKVDLVRTGDGTYELTTTTDLTLISGIEEVRILGGLNVQITAATDTGGVVGNSGDNVLNDGGNSMVLTGNGGDDTYIVGNSGTKITETSGGGRDTVKAKVDFRLAGDDYVEVLTTTSYVGSSDIDLTGNGFRQTIVGNAGDNILHTGGGSADTLKGGRGNDLYRIYNKNDVIIEVAGYGVDRVSSAVDYKLGASDEIEMLTTNGSGGRAAIDLFGNAYAQTIIGNAGRNVLSDGGGAADVMEGRQGDDTYIVRNSETRIIEMANGGSDRVAVGADYVLGAGMSIENLTTTSVAGKSGIDLTGNEGSQRIIGNAGNNILRDGGGDGADVLVGSAGNDTYILASARSRIFEEAGNGRDKVAVNMDFILNSAAQIENLTTTSFNGTKDIDLRGNIYGQLITGNAGDNVLHTGGGAADVLQGGKGDDVYRIYNSNDRIIEIGGEGWDRVTAAVDYTLEANDYIEVLSTNGASGTSDINLTGNFRSQTIIGNNGDNRLDGAGGRDIYNGGGGADTFVFSVAPDAKNFARIVDFEAGRDRIALDRDAFAAIGSSLSASEFRADVTGRAADANDRILYDTDSGWLWYDADGNGAGERAYFAQVGAGLNLTADDFLIF